MRMVSASAAAASAACRASCLALAPVEDKGKPASSCGTGDAACLGGSTMWPVADSGSITTDARWRGGGDTTKGCCNRAGAVDADCATASSTGTVVDLAADDDDPGVVLAAVSARTSRPTGAPEKLEAWSCIGVGRVGGEEDGAGGGALGAWGGTGGCTFASAAASTT
ncbi:unnamed protein product [Ectocarpus sp. CCAP 1310/34]|nr:unnamed protein product [Ectocarpus sp. CCAP 1310/34]